MKAFASLLAILCLGRPLRLGAAERPLPTRVSTYLTDFGYLPTPAPGTSNVLSEKAVRRAILRLQKFGGLETTGVLDDATKQLMSSKRCGIPDFQFEDPNNQSLGGHRRRRRHRRRRYALQGAKWDSPNLTYRLINYSTRMGPGKVKRAVHDALKQWADVSGLTFTETESHHADIQVSFHSRGHGDGYPFDGPDVVLAHAFFPGDDLGGDAHFDNDEKWTEKPLSKYSQEVNLFSVAAHEFGHSLGLSHSDVQDSLMYPYYRYETKDKMLHYDDIIAIQRLYGTGGNPVPEKPPPTTAAPKTAATYAPVTYAPTKPTTTVEGPPDVCHTQIDAVSRIRNEIFTFKGSYFWRFDEEGYLIEAPVRLDRFWFGISENVTRIDAVYEPRNSNTIVFFTGRQYWKFQANRKLPGYPRRISELGLPNELERIDAAFVWEYNSVSYLFAGDKYWRFDERNQRVEIDYPRSIDLWEDLPHHLDSAYTDKLGVTYFFKGFDVFRFNNKFMKVERSYPTKIDRHWTHCNPELKNPRFEYQRQAASQHRCHVLFSLLTISLLYVTMPL